MPLLQRTKNKNNLIADTSNLFTRNISIRQDDFSNFNRGTRSNRRDGRLEIRGFLGRLPRVVVEDRGVADIYSIFRAFSRQGLENFVLRGEVAMDRK